MNNPMMKWLWLALVVIVLDQLTKWLASDLLVLHQPLVVMPMFNLTLMHNTGAAFSFLHDAGGWQRWLFTLIAIVVSIVIVAWLKQLKSKDVWQAVGLSLILGGAIGNVIDRLVHGYVVDFIQIYYDIYYWPAFNIADSAITVGVGILILDGIRDYRQQRKHKSDTGKVNG